MTTVTIDEALTDLKRLIHEAKPGEEIVLTENDRPVARITPVQTARTPRTPGTAKDMILYMADDFDAPMELVDSKEIEDLRNEVAILRSAAAGG